MYFADVFAAKNHLLGNGDKMINYNVYPDYENQVKIINEICKEYKVKKFSIGKSLCGRDIFALQICGKGQAIIAGGFHGTEYLTVLAALKFAEEYAENTSGCGVTIVPCVNPDGTEIAINGTDFSGEFYPIVSQTCRDKRLWKANARGVDINHNFDACWNRVKANELALGINKPACTRYGGCAPESEPETQAIVRLCTNMRFERALALHSQGREIYWDFGNCTPKECLELAKRMADVSGYKISSPEEIATGGGFKDWFIQKFHRCGFTVEMGLGTNPLPVSDFQEEYPVVKKILTEFVNF